MQVEPKQPVEGEQLGVQEGAPQAQVLEDQVNAQGAEVLAQKGAPPQGADLAEKKVEQKKGWGEAITSFWNRRFGKISSDDQKKADEITQLSSQIEAELKQTVDDSKKARNAEKKFAGAYPSDQTVQNENEFLAAASTHLQTAQTLLITLKAKETDADELAEKHAAFDSLPTTIKRLEKEINLLEGRITLGKQLVKLEEKMKDYKPDEKWEQFKAVGRERHALYGTIKQLVTNNPALRDDPALKKYADKKNLLASDTSAIISLVYPDLKGNVGRIFDATHLITNNRLDNLRKQVQVLLPLFSKHRAVSKLIESLESSIHSKSLTAKISRLVHGKEALEAQLEDAKNESAIILQDLKDKGQFDHEELKWLAERGEHNWAIKTLAGDITDVQTSLEYLELRDPVSHEIGQLIDRITEYGGAKVQLKRAKTPEYTKTATKAVVDTKAAIISDFRKLSPQLETIKERKKGSLPADFDTLDEFSKFKVLIPLAFPSLKIKNGILSDLIVEQELTEDFNQAIQEGEEKVPPVPERDEEAQVLGTASFTGEHEEFEDLSSSSEAVVAAEGAVLTEIAPVTDVPAPPSLPPAAAAKAPAPPPLTESPKAEEPQSLAPPPPPPPPPTLPPAPQKLVTENLTEEGAKDEGESPPSIKIGDLPPVEEKQPSPGPSMLDQIKAGKALKKANVVQVRDYDALQEAIRNGIITKAEDITPAEWGKLSDDKQTAIRLSLKFKPVEDGADSGSESDFE